MDGTKSPLVPSLFRTVVRIEGRGGRNIVFPGIRYEESTRESTFNSIIADGKFVTGKEKVLIVQN